MEKTALMSTITNQRYHERRTDQKAMTTRQDHNRSPDVNQRSKTRSGTQYQRSNQFPEHQGPRHDFEILHRDSYHTNRRRDEEDYYPNPTYVDRHLKQIPVPQSIPEYSDENGQRRRLTQFDRAKIAADKYGGQTLGAAITNYQDQTCPS